MASTTDQRRARLLRLGLVLGLAAVVVLIAIVLGSGGGSGKPATGGSGGAGTASNDAAAVSKRYAGIPQNGVTLGDPHAKTTLIEFADLQCPYCAQYADQAMPTVVDKYVRTGKLRYELRIRAFLGPDSLRAAGAAAAATQQNHLIQFADLVFHRQGQENSGYVTDQFLTDAARASGVDGAAAVAAAKTARQQPTLRAAETKAASLGSQSTPDFFLKLASGRLVPVQPSDLTAAAFTQALDQALAQT
jgi:protein-disulfide isomerase